MTIKNVTIAGGGVLGSQIAFQTAFSGFNVTLYDINDAAIVHAKELLAIRQNFKRFMMMAIERRRLLMVCHLILI